MNAMTYKGYTARIDFDDADRVFVGRIAGIHDIVSFHADTVADLEIALRESVDDYLAACAQFGKVPEKAASGKLMLRVPPKLHSAALVAAESSGVSLNQWATNALSQALQMA